jgi:pyridoxal/pyridoxine/pyridoxamine kinase
VVGAGDKFAAYILNGLLEETNDPSKVIQEAHNRLTEYFKNEKV